MGHQEENWVELCFSPGRFVSSIQDIVKLLAFWN